MGECAARISGTILFSVTFGLAAGFPRTTHYARSAGSPTSRSRRCLIDSTRCIPRSAVPSIPPEKLLRALLLQAFYSIRSERQLMEQMDYNLLFRWFVGLSVDEPVWDPTVFTKNRQRMLDGEIAAAFMDAVLNQNE